MKVVQLGETFSFLFTSHHKKKLSRSSQDLLCSIKIRESTLEDTFPGGECLPGVDSEI